MIRSTSPVLCVTIMLHPRPSITSMLSVFHSGHDTEHFSSSVRDDNVTSQTIHNINALRLSCLPRTSHESIRFACQCSNRAEVDNIARQLRHDHLLNIGANLHIVAPASGAQVLHSSHLTGETHTPGAVDTSGHDRLDQWSNVLVLHRPLATKLAVSEP